MEAFSLLKYWRGGGSVAAALHPSSQTTNATTTTVLTAVTQHENATDSDEDCGGGGGDDGPFFDLEFTVPDEVDDSEENAHGNPNANNCGNNSNTEHRSDGDEEEDDDDAIEECEREFKFTLSPSSNDRSSDDPNLSLSPSENLFFKGKLVQVEEPSSSSEPNAKPQFTASLFKSATKFRVFMSGLKKLKPNNAASSSSSSDKESANNGSDSVHPEPQKKQQQPAERKHFTVKFKVEEVPIVSLFTRDNSSKGGNKKHNPEESPSSSSEEKRPSSSKEAMKNKYLKMVKPLYIRVSRRYGDKLRFSGQISLSSSAGKSAPPRDIEEKKGSPAKAAAESDSGGGGENRETNAKSEKQGNLPSGLRIACKRLGKSRSASSAVAAAPPTALLTSNRRDDSLLQQQDGIQGAILHCKRSFNASRPESESCEVPCSVVSEMMVTTSEVSRNSTNEGRDKRA